MLGTLLLSPLGNAATTDYDKQFLSTAARSDMNEIKLSQLTEKKGLSPQLKRFAKKMVSDHNKLEMQMKPFATKWNLMLANRPGCRPSGDLRSAEWTFRIRL